MQRYAMFFIVVSALHVSGGFSAHHQELKNCTCSIGSCQTCVLLPLAWLSRSDSTDASCTVFELLMMSGKTARNM
jgi:hypothetical protein